MTTSSINQDTNMKANSKSLWFGFFGGLAAWFAHLSVSYVLVYLGCVLGLNSLRLWLVVVTVLFALVALAALVMAYQNWQRTREMDNVNGEIDLTRIHF